jgi:hypothetical protein
MLAWPENLLRRLRFMPPTTMPTGCIEFTGALNKGYGITRKNGRTAQAHRASYELVRGPIPDGLHIDHLCENPPCVNPGHLEPVTQAENTRRYAKALPHCKIDGCTGQVHGYGWCVRHYGRWRRHGDPLAGRVSPGQSMTPRALKRRARAVSEGGSISEGNAHE